MSNANFKARSRRVRNIWIGVIVLAVALVATAATYYAFERYLHVLLPRGLWTGF